MVSVEPPKPRRSRARRARPRARSRPRRRRRAARNRVLRLDHGRHRRPPAARRAAVHCVRSAPIAGNATTRRRGFEDHQRLAGLFEARRVERRDQQHQDRRLDHHHARYERGDHQPARDRPQPSHGADTCSRDAEPMPRRVAGLPPAWPQRHRPRVSAASWTSVPGRRSTPWRSIIQPGYSAGSALRGVEPRGARSIDSTTLGGHQIFLELVAALGADDHRGHPHRGQHARPAPRWPPTHRAPGRPPASRR